MSSIFQFIKNPYCWIYCSYTLCILFYSETKINLSLREKCPNTDFFSGPYFPAFGLNTDRYFVSLRIQSECEKIRTRKNSVFEHLSRSLFYLLSFTFILFPSLHHSLSFVAIRYHSLYHLVSLLVIRCDSLSFAVTCCRSLLFVVTCYHSLSLVVSWCTTRLSI